jgi:hypothetical protein
MQSPSHTPMNKPVIVFSIGLLICLKLVDLTTPDSPPENAQELLREVVWMVLCTPVLIAWVQCLWNNTIPQITNWQPITLWQATGVLALAALLFSL